MKKLIFSVLVFTLALTIGCKSNEIHGKAKVVGEGGSRPEWVDDVSVQSQAGLADILDHNTEKPEFYYAVSQANVDNQTLLPNCFEFARVNSANEFARSIAEEVTGSSATSQDQSSSAFYSETLAKTKTKLVGVQVLAKHWENIQEEDESTKTICWIIAGMPIANYNKLKEESLKDATSSGKMKTKIIKQVEDSQDDADENNDSDEDEEDDY